MGTEGVGHPQFMRELYTCPQSPIKIPGLNDADLNIFVQDLPFNFTIEQALEHMGDLGVLT